VAVIEKPVSAADDDDDGDKNDNTNERKEEEEDDDRLLTVDQLCPGFYCAVLSTTDNCWYRAKVSQTALKHFYLHVTSTLSMFKAFTARCTLVQVLSCDCMSSIHL